MKLKKVLKISSIILLIVAIIVLSFALWFVIDTVKDVKNLQISLNDKSVACCDMFDSQKNLISSTQGIKNTYVELSQINKQTIDAFLSIEDKKFYNHDGLNYPRMIKAVFTNIKKSEYAEGASTISQQLIKNKYLTNEKTIKRKIKEIYLTKKLEASESKDDILESYLNTIYYGNGAYGIGNASMKFFSKTPSELTLSESCILAGVVNSPANYSPINNIEKCKARRNLVLNEMLEDGRITNEEYISAINEDIIVNESKITSINSLDLYSKNVLREASEILGLSEQEILNRNYKIYTYKDESIQNTLSKIINDDKYYDKNSYGNIADSLSIILDNETGGVVAVDGRSEYDLIDFKRQPGSLVKPVLVYTPAIEEKLIYTCSEILDEKTDFGKYSPKNVGDEYYGYVSIKDAVAKSLNIPSIKLCQELGVNKCKEYGEKCGLEFDENDVGLAIALGGLTNGFTLQNITESYLPYTNSGMFKNSAYISKIVSPNNLTIYNRKMSENNYCSAESAYLMTDTLNYSTKYGTSKKLSNCNYDIAGKTGTVNIKDSNLNTDAYSLAYTSKHTMSVWLGNYSMNEEFNLNGYNNGGTFATEIIRDTFNTIYEDNSPPDFEIPDGIVSLPIDTISLNEQHEIYLGNDLPQRFQKYELFAKDNVPSTLTTNINCDTNFTLDCQDNYIGITLDCKDYITYSIYRIDNNNRKKLIKNVYNHTGLFEYKD